MKSLTSMCLGGEICAKFRRDTLSITGPITTAEIEAQTTWWIRRVQTHAQNTPKVVSDKLQLNLQPKGEKILECRGRYKGIIPSTYQMILFSLRSWDVTHINAPLMGDLV